MIDNVLHNYLFCVRKLLQIIRSIFFSVLAMPLPSKKSNVFFYNLSSLRQISYPCYSSIDRIEEQLGS